MLGMSSFLDQLREALKADQRSSAELAQLAVISPVSLRRFMAGRSENTGLSIEAVERPANLLGVEITLVPVDRGERSS